MRSPKHVLLSLLLGAVPVIAHAQTVTIPTPSSVSNSKFGSVTAIIQNGFNIVITVASVVFVVLMLIGGMMYLASAGNDESTKKARQLMLDSVIGLVIVVTAWAVGLYVLRVLGLGDGTNLNI